MTAVFMVYRETHLITRRSKTGGHRPPLQWGRRLPSNHQNGERAGYCRCLAAAAAGGRRRWRRATLLAHRQDVVCLAVESDGSRTVHRVQVLLDLETRRAFLFNDG